MCNTLVWEVIPGHIIQLIFSKLSIINLPLCRLVSQTWNHLILDYASHSKLLPNTYFLFISYNQSLPFLPLNSTNIWSNYLTMHCIDFHQQYSQHINLKVVGSFRFNPSFFDVRVSNSCNGLLCVINGMNCKRTCAGILNPMTSEYIKLSGYEPSSSSSSSSSSSHDFFDKFYLYGFGFSSQMMQYKVARVSYDVNKYGSVVEIFTLGQNNKWRYVEFLSFIIENDGVYFNGALYWVGQEEDEKRVVSCLDVEEENFEIISLPIIGYSVAVGVLNDTLYATFGVGSEDYKFEVWRMQSFGGGRKDSWIKEFVVDDIPKDWKSKLSWNPWKEYLQLIKACENGEILCLLNKFYLFLYNPKTRKIKTYELDDASTIWIYQIQSINFDSLHNILVGRS